MNNNRRVATNKLANSRQKTHPYGRPSASSSKRLAQRRREEEELEISTPKKLVSKLKGYLTPSAWRSPSSNEASTSAATTTNDSISALNTVSTPTTSTYATQSGTRYPPLMNEQYSGINIVDSTPDSPNHKLMEFFLKKGSGDLSEIERQGVLALIKQASERNESLLDVSPGDLQRRVLENRVVAAAPATPILRSQTPTNTSALQLNPDTSRSFSNVSSPASRSVMSRFNTPIKQSPVTAPRYSPLYTNTTRKDSNVAVKRISATPEQLFSISTPYKLKAGTAVSSRGSFAKPTAASLAKHKEVASTAGAGTRSITTGHTAPVSVATPKKKMEPKNLSKTASIINSILDERRSEEGASPSIENKPGPSPLKSVYASSAQSPRAAFSATPSRPQPQTQPKQLGAQTGAVQSMFGFPQIKSSSYASDTPKTEEASTRKPFEHTSISTPTSSSPSLLRKETLSSSMKKSSRTNGGSTTPQAHPYRPSKASSLRQAVTASPVNDKSSASSFKPGGLFQFPGNTESARKTAPIVSPAKRLFGESPLVTNKKASPEMDMATEPQSFKFQLPADKEANGSSMSLDSFRESTADVSMGVNRSDDNDESMRTIGSEDGNHGTLAEFKKEFSSKFTLPSAPSSEELECLEGIDVAATLDQYREAYSKKFV